MTTTLEYLRTEKRDEILALAQQHGVKDVRVFGSVVREEDTDESDIDFLIELNQGGKLGNWFDFWDDLENLLGRDVDVVQEKSLHWFIKPQVLAEAQML